jgi:hypothetical protein
VHARASALNGQQHALLRARLLLLLTLCPCLMSLTPKLLHADLLQHLVDLLQHMQLLFCLCM